MVEGRTYGRGRRRKSSLLFLDDDPQEEEANITSEANVTTTEANATTKANATTEVNATTEANVTTEANATTGANVTTEANVTTDVNGKRLLTISLERDEDLDDREKIIADASLHVQQAADQRRLSNANIKEAEDDIAANKSHANARRTIVCDYSQNGAVPSFNESQPGDTYYMIPLRVALFGIVDTATSGGEISRQS